MTNTTESTGTKNSTEQSVGRGAASRVVPQITVGWRRPVNAIRYPSRKMDTSVSIPISNVWLGTATTLALSKRRAVTQKIVALRVKCWIRIEDDWALGRSSPSKLTRNDVVSIFHEFGVLLDELLAYFLADDDDQVLRLSFNFSTR